MARRGITYKDAGVDIDAGDALVERIKSRVDKLPRPGVVAGIGGFAAMFSIKDAFESARRAGVPIEVMEDPLLVSGTDGVGTKLMIAFKTGRHDTVGIDLVAMCVNDVLTTGAHPLFFLDYFATGRLDIEVADQVIAGIAKGCELAGCALIGGETAELPGLYAEGEYDLAGFAVGVVDRSKVIDGQAVAPGDVVIGVQSRGLHSNGYSLARRVLLEHAKLPLDGTPKGLTRPLGEELLAPTAIYSRTVRALLERARPRAIAHITGGGIGGNLPRVLPDGAVAEIHRSAWEIPPLFGLIERLGEVTEEEMFQTFNMGLGLVVVVERADRDAALRAITESGERPFVVGEIHRGDGPARVALDA